MMLVYGFSRTLINSNAAIADLSVHMKQDTVHAVGHTWGTRQMRFDEFRQMIDKQKLMEVIDKRIQELRDIDDPTWVYPYILQRIDELKWLKNCVEKMDSSTNLYQMQSAGENEVEYSVKIKTNTREVHDDT